MRTYVCPRCKARWRREEGLAGNELLCPECAYQTASPKTATLACQLGEYYSDLGHTDKAIAAYTEASQLAPTHAAAYVALANLHFARKDYAKAIGQYAEALRRGPADAKIHLNRGKCHFELNDYPRAEADFTAALRLAPENVWAYHSRGYLFLTQGKHDQAIRDFTEAIRLEPRQALPHSLRGMAHVARGAHDRAIVDFSRAIEHRLRDVKVFYLLGKSHLQLRNFDKAIAAFTEALRLDPRHAETYVARGEAYWLRHKLDNARADYAQALRINPTMSEAYASRAFLHLAMRHFDAALADLSVASRLDPHSAEVRRRIEVVLDAKDPGRKAARTQPPKPGVPVLSGPRPPNAAAPVVGREPGYFYRRKHVVYGPHTLQELIELAGAAQLLPTDDVQKEGSGDWQPARAWKEFTFPAAAAPAAPLPPPELPPAPAYEPGPPLDADAIWQARVREKAPARKYFYRRNRSCYGPYTPQELRELAESGRLRPDDDVQKEGGAWKPAGDLPKLFTGIDPRKFAPIQAPSNPVPAAPPNQAPVSAPAAPAPPLTPSTPAPTPPLTPKPVAPPVAPAPAPLPPPVAPGPAAEGDSIVLPPEFLAALARLSAAPRPNEAPKEEDRKKPPPGLLPTQLGPPTPPAPGMG